MKKIYSLLIIGLLLVSCDDVLDKKDLGAIDENLVWSNDPKAIEINVNSFYANYMPKGMFAGIDARNTNAVTTDEARSGYNGRGAQIVNGNRFSADRDDVPFQSWNYAAIRKLNEFLINIETRYILPSGALPEEIALRNRFIGEAKFFRAHVYWEMIRVYGGVPIITTVTDRFEKDPNILYPKRKTTEESFKFVIDELTEAANLLPENYGGKHWGRITKGAALAYLGRVQLFKASPLFNPSNDTQLWKDAYDTYTRIELLQQYELHSDFSKIWMEKGILNKEIILFTDFMKGQITHGWDAGNMMRSLAVGDATANCPTQELVDAFPMKNGKPYVKPATESDPYSNRDPRLHATVVTNGQTFGPRREVIYTFVSESTDTQNPLYNFNGIDLNQSCTSTGYYMRKMMDESLDGKEGDYGYNFGSYTQWAEIRYAEVLLSLAEAANELNKTEEGVDLIIKLRKRAGIDAGVDNRYGIPAGISQVDFRKLVQNERFIELAFENKRYWDLRRWKLAHIALSKQLNAMEIKKVMGAGDTFTFTYKRRLIRHDRTYRPSFLEKFYLLPLPKGELLKNKNLEQNEDWK